MPFESRSIFWLRAIARMLSGENFFRGGIESRYGVRRKNLSSFGLSCTILWLFLDPHETDVSQKLRILLQDAYVP